MPSSRSVRTRFAALAGAALLFAGTALPALACTNLKFETEAGGVLRARTMELEGDMKSQVLITPKGTELTGYDATGQLAGMTWTAKYTTVGLNAFGVNVHVDGINEAGLTGGALMFPEFSEYQQPDPARLDETIAGEQVVSWALTSFATVEEVKAGLPNVLVVDSEIPPAPVAFPLHYIFTDRTGASVVVEYVGGELQLHDAPLGILTNSPTYDFHVINLANYANLTVNSVPVRDIDTIQFAPISTGGSLVGMPGDFTSISRFIRATIYSQALQKPAAADDGVLQGFHVMNQFDIPQGVVPTNVNSAGASGTELEHTQWTVVYDLETPRMFVSTIGDRGVQSVDLAKVDATKGVQTIPLSQETQIVDLLGG